MHILTIDCNISGERIGNFFAEANILRIYSKQAIMQKVCTYELVFQCNDCLNLEFLFENSRTIIKNFCGYADLDFLNALP